MAPISWTVMITTTLKERNDEAALKERNDEAAFVQLRA
jgi:hypothetical protein